MENRVRKKYRDWIEGLELGIAGVTPEGEIRSANARFAEILGLPAQTKIVGKNLMDYLTAASGPSLLEALEETKKGRVEGEIQVVRGEQSRIIDAIFDRIHAKTPIIRAVISEITKAVETKQTLRKYEASVQSLSARILRLQDEERRRIARELHDTTGQELAVMLMALSQVNRSLEQNGAPESLRQKLRDAVTLARKAEDQIRTLSYVLHPPLLDELGLGAALRWYAEGFKKRTGIQVEIIAPEETPRLAAEYETALFRVVQEGLSNILRHAESHRAKVELSFEEGNAEIAIRDYGKGIPEEKLENAAKGKTLGVGIAGMRERLKQLGGGLEIRSNERGTLVTARVPMEGADSAVGEAATRAVAEVRSAHQDEAPKRILVVEDHEVTRRGIRALLENEPDLEVCGEAENGVQAVTKAAELQPDLVLLDLTMPQAGGFSAMKHIRQSSQETKILVFSIHAHPHLITALRTLGCNGYVNKGKASEDLVRGIRTVLSGIDFFSPETAERGNSSHLA